MLDFAGAGYLSGPEQRAYYEALPLDYKLKEDEEGFSQYIIMEASPLVDCVPAGPVKMDVKRVLYSVYPVNFNPVNLCDHNNEHPQKMYADKTYLMAVADGWAHDFKEKGPQATFEYAPIEGPYSTQADADGNRRPTELTGNWIVEVTPGFYDTKEGQDWLNLCEEHLQRKIHLSLPVTATQNLNLIMAFYTKQAYVAQGETFSQEDYRQGNKVCLVSDRFAVRNGLKVGDSLHLALRYANYAASPGRGGAEGYLKADGGVYEVFEESDYTIKGIYEVGVGTDGDWGYVLDRNEVFIPDASIKNSNADNIALHGPMKGYTTSLLTGILVVALAGSIAGSLAGQFFAGRAVLQMAATETFDTRFSNGEVQFNMEKSEEEMADEGAHGNGIAKSVYLTQTHWQTSAVCGGLVFLFTMGMAFAGIHRNLREEPLALLSECEK